MKRKLSLGKVCVLAIVILMSAAVVEAKTDSRYIRKNNNSEVIVFCAWRFW